MLCGRPATSRKCPGISAPSIAWVLVSPLIGLIFFWMVILFDELRGRGDGKAGLPFCDAHKNYWFRRAVVIVGGFFTIVVLMVVGHWLSPATPPGAKQPEQVHWLFGVAGFVLLIYLPLFLILQLSALRPTKTETRTKRKSFRVYATQNDFLKELDDDMITFTRVSPKFVEALEQRPDTMPLPLQGGIGSVS
jgi:hypothetical protein